MRYIKENRYDIIFLISLLLFVLFSYYVVPFTHELGHIIFLKAFKCYYWPHFEYGFFKSFYGTIYERCVLSNTKLAWIYIGGVFLTFTIGILLLIIEYIFHKKHHTEKAIPFLFVSYAFLLDFVNYLFFKEGDLIEFMRLIGLKNKIIYLPVAGILFVILLLTYLYININSDVHIIIEEEEHFLKKIIKKLKKNKNK